MTNRISLKFEFPLINICRGKEGERKTGFWNLAKYFRLVKVTLTKSPGECKSCAETNAQGLVPRAGDGEAGRMRGEKRDGLCKCGHLVGNQFSALPFIRGLCHLYAATCGNASLFLPDFSAEKKKRQKEIGSLRGVKDVVVLFEFRWNERTRNEWRYLKEFNVVDIYKICALLHGDGLDWNSRFRSSESNVWFRRVLYLDLEEILRGTYCTVVGSD